MTRVEPEPALRWASRARAERAAGGAALRVVSNRDSGLAHENELAEGWRREPQELAWRFAADPEGHFVAREGGEVLGTASCLAYEGGLAWVGGMVVKPTARGRGVGRALLRACLAHAEARGARVVGLDATDEGRPLYEAEGFRAVGATPRWSRPAWGPRPTPAASPYAIFPVSACELMDLARYDAARFGAHRAPWLAAAMADFPDRCFVAFHKPSGDLAGFALARAQLIGPVVADAPEAAMWLIRACEAAGAPARAQLLAANPRAAQAFAALGYRPDGATCLRMVRGGVSPGKPGAVYAIGGWAVG